MQGGQFIHFAWRALTDTKNATAKFRRRSKVLYLGSLDFIH